jgi:osmotically-inducible protein OsmY
MDRPRLGAKTMEDKALRKLVQDELDWEPSVDSADIGVTVEKGIVRLTGRVPSFAQKLAAESAVRRVKGVRGFVDDLEIRAFTATYSDEAIALRVANLIEWDAVVPKNTVKVKVDGGFVTLTGTVDWHYQRLAAEHGIARLLGVRGVANQIAVKPHPEAGDIKRRIKEALERQADVEAEKVSIAIEGDKVRLDGKVRAWSEREAIEHAAWAAPGVRSVEDRITVGY